MGGGLAHLLGHRDGGCFVGAASREFQSDGVLAQSEGERAGADAFSKTRLTISAIWLWWIMYIRWWLPPRCRTRS